MTNHYQVLGIPTNATAEQIKAAYREYAKHYHPDKHSNNEFFKRRFQDVQNAYEILADANKRAEFDKRQAATETTESVFTISRLKIEVNKLTIDRTRARQALDENKKLLDRALTDNNALLLDVARLKEELNRRPSPKPVQNVTTKVPSRNKGRQIAVTLFLLFAGILCVLTVVYQSYIHSANPFAKEPRIDLNKGWERVVNLEQANKNSEIISYSDSLLNSGSSIDYDVHAIWAFYPFYQLADIYTMRGYGKALCKNDTGAVHDFTRSILRRGDDAASPYFYRALAKGRLGDEMGYIKDLNKAIVIYPEGASMLSARGYYYVQKSRYDEAFKDYTALLKVEPDNADNISSYGLVLYKLGEKGKACSEWRKAADLGSKDAFWYIKQYCN